MRKLHAWALATLALFLAPQALSAQSLTEAAAKEKERRKVVKGAKSFTEDDLARAGGAGASVNALPESTPEEAPKEGQAAPAEKKDEKTPDELKAEANAAWRKRLDAAQQNVRTQQELAGRIQNDLNDTSGGFYGARRTSLVAYLEETQKKLADAQQQVSALEDEGRKNAYR
jgi:hypothetical protein